MGGFRLHRSLCLVCGEGNRRNCNTMHLVRVLWVGQEIPTVSSNFFLERDGLSPIKRDSYSQGATTSIGLGMLISHSYELT